MSEEHAPGKLLLVRHAESEWNALGKWTGRTDVSLTEKGVADAKKLGEALAGLGVAIDAAYCSEQVRTRQTLEGMLKAAELVAVPVAASGALNERDYGEYTGKNKWEMKELLGDDAFTGLRRGWDVAIPGGETLKMVYGRVIPFYLETVLPQLLAGRNVLIVAHGNSLRALKKYLESITDEEIGSVEMPFGHIVLYDVSQEGRALSTASTSIETTGSHA